MSILQKYITEKYFIVQRYLTIRFDMSTSVAGTPSEFLSQTTCTIHYYDLSTNTFVNSVVTDGNKLIEYLNGGVKFVELSNTQSATETEPLYLYSCDWNVSQSPVNGVSYINIEGWELNVSVDGGVTSITLAQGAAPARLNNWFCWDCAHSWYATPSPNYPTICPDCGSDNIMVPNIDAQCDECGTLFTSTIYGECPNCGYGMYTYIDTTGPWVCYDCDYEWDAPEGHNPSVCPRCGSDNIDYDGK